jgi:hypothetical protein
MNATRNSPGRRTALISAAVIEAVSLLGLLINLGTAHRPGIAAALGPIHGTAYLITIALAWTEGFPRRTRLLTLIPGVGGILALWTTPTTHGTTTTGTTSPTDREIAPSPDGRQHQPDHPGHR